MKYLKLFENVDFKKISDEIDSLDIEEQSKIIKKLKRFTFDKVKEINKRNREIKNKEIYGRIGDVYDYAINLSKNSYLKNIDFNLDIFEIKKEYIKKINRKSLNSIETDLNNNKITIIDQITIKFYNNNINIGLYIFQYINKEKDLIYRISSANNKNNDRFKILYKFLNKKEFDNYINEFKNNLKDLEIEIKAMDYNL